MTEVSLGQCLLMSVCGTCLADPAAFDLGRGFPRSIGWTIFVVVIVVKAVGCLTLWRCRRLETGFWLTVVGCHRLTFDSSVA